MSNSQMKLYWDRSVDLLQRCYASFLPGSARRKYQTSIRGNVFTNIMRQGLWGEKYRSGIGSTLEYTKAIRGIAEKVINDFHIQSMVDLGCGDFVWMPLVLKGLPPGFRYIGGDIVPELISKHTAAYPQYEFRVIDFVADDLPAGDLIFCRDALQHLPVPDIKKALKNFSRSGARYLLAVTHLRQFGWENARNRRVGQVHDRNLLLAPFNLCDPIVIYAEQDPYHKFLGLWRLPLTDSNGDLI
jgi:hypothetical protein